MDSVEQVDAGALGRGEGEGVELAGGFVDVEAGAADDDPFGEREEALRVTPLREREKAVEADEVEERGVWMVEREGGEDVDGVVGGAVFSWRVKLGGAKTLGVCGIGGAGEGRHGEAVGEGGSGSGGFERLTAGGSEENLIKRKLGSGGGSDGEVAAMDGVEGAPEEGYAHERL